MFVVPYVPQPSITDYGLRFASYRFSASLADATDTLLTIPGGAPRYKAVIKAATLSQVWVSINQPASAPAGADFAATDSEMIIGTQALCREVVPGDVLHFFSATADTLVSVVLYGLVTTS